MRNDTSAPDEPGTELRYTGPASAIEAAWTRGGIPGDSDGGVRTVDGVLVAGEQRVVCTRAVQDRRDPDRVGAAPVAVVRGSAFERRGAADQLAVPAGGWEVSTGLARVARGAVPVGCRL